MMQNDEPINSTGMNDNIEKQDNNKMESLLEEEGLNIDFPKAGETRDGIVASISDGQILVSVGAKSEGVITGKEYEAIPDDILENLSVGDLIPVYVITPEDSNGNLILSFVRAIEEQSWLDAESLKENGESYESTVVGYNKGGLLVPLGTIRGFVPSSQLSLSRRLGLTGDTPEEKFKEMIGEKVELCVIEVDRERRRLILSERAASSETREMIKEKVIDDLMEGDIKVGRVTSLADFGAFVSISGADGLVHLSEISWDRIGHPSEVLEIGQEIKVKIISIDKEKRRIGLSIRQLQNDPWTNHVKDLKVGQLVEGEITRLTNFGAFAKLKIENLDGDLEGLIHISEVSERRIDHPKEIIHVGDVVTLRIIKIEEDTHRIGLSIRRVDSPAYADLDWKNLSEEIDLSETSNEGENLGAFMEAESVPSDEIAEDSPAPEILSEDTEVKDEQISLADEDTAVEPDIKEEAVSDEETPEDAEAVEEKSENS